MKSSFSLQEQIILDVILLLISTYSISEIISQGSYRKPLEMLLNLVDKHWKGERSLHQNNNFLCEFELGFWNVACTH